MDNEDNSKKKVKAIEEVEIKPLKGGHPARSPRFRADTGYVSDRHEYYAKHYQKNKAKVAKKKKERYANSEAVREYHRKKSMEYYRRNRVSVGIVNKTVKTTTEGERLYSINHAAHAIGFSTPYFRDLTRKGVIPEASYKNTAKWRMYTEGQIKLLKRAMIYYNQHRTADETQAVLFCFWDDPEAGMSLSTSACLTLALKTMKNKVKEGITLLKT